MFEKVKIRNKFAKELRENDNLKMKVIGAKKGRGSHTRKDKYPVKYDLY